MTLVRRERVEGHEDSNETDWKCSRTLVWILVLGDGVARPEKCGAALGHDERWEVRKAFFRKRDAEVRSHGGVKADQVMVILEVVREDRQSSSAGRWMSAIG